jgi:hypothetical protein
MAPLYAKLVRLGAVDAATAADLPISPGCTPVVARHVRQAPLPRGRRWRPVPDRPDSNRRRSRARCRTRARPIASSHRRTLDSQAPMQHGAAPLRRRLRRRRRSGSDPPPPDR